jgi:poly(3-hydroxybutyrate) depolymerase
MKQTIISKHINGLEPKCSSFNSLKNIINVFIYKVFNFHLFFILLLFCCFSNSVNAQIEDFKVGTTTRKMLVYAPSTIVPNRPLLISMHGYNQDIAYQKNQTQWETIAKAENFVVVYPGGIGNAWDITGNTDIDFILAIIDEMVKRYGIDRDRVYLSGFSMGGMMTYYAATKIADKIAAFAPVSGYNMGGPNTNSSRPIPIIHVHGTSDDVVVYSGVAASMNAWVIRNGCPTTPVVTKPYPVGKSTSDEKKYWGPGTDSVEVVLISLSGKGHWHSIETSGVNTSQEIWNFCKRFALGFGVPKFKAALIADANPKQIQVTFSKPLKALTKFEGFAVKVDGQDAAINTVVLTDSVHLAVNLVNSVLKTSEIALAYDSGNVVSVYNKTLVAFNTLVDNQLFGASPKLIGLTVNEKGDSLIARFNKKMLLPAEITSLALKADFNGQKNVSLISCAFFNIDSTMLMFPLGDTVYADYKLTLSYTGTNVVSSDSGMLKKDTAYIVTNNSLGLPVHIISGTIDESAIAISLEFNKPMSMKDAQISQFSLKVNGRVTTIKEVFNINNTIRLNLLSSLYYRDSIVITYTPGNVTAADKGALDAFTDFAVENPIGEPIYSALPGKIEAENYTMQFGIDTETTSDAGGGLNVGWIDAGDWLVYAIENNTEDTAYQICFRLATQASGSKFNYFIDDVKIGQIDVPNTGAWQTFTSLVKGITLPKGKHYFKIVDVTGNFNINYFEVQKSFVSISHSNTDNISIFPNPASDKIVIKSSEFKYDLIEVSDMMGRTVLVKSMTYAPEVILPLNLSKGVYFIKISNGNSSYSCKVNIR